jgi:hypothetical protein
MAGRSKYDNPFEEGGADEVNPFAVSRKPAQAQLAPALSSVRLFLLPLLQIDCFCVSAPSFLSFFLSFFRSCFVS